ncbi:MAG: NAD(P)H-dependent oxidoreductase subunit E [Candidatus Lokiarchaeota archaeon]|nr:NAD(P)H-dependent oxidoreductase subunit E [Candidatus Lokiarchaeota archaeon]
MIKIADITNIEERKAIENIIRNYREDSGTVISLLQDIQGHYNYLPAYILQLLSRELKIPLSKIYSVATFYAQFSFNEKGKHIITVCDGTACHVKGGPLLYDYLINQLGIHGGETTPDKIFSIEIVRCLGCCAISPVMIVDDELYGNLNMQKISKILSKIRKEEMIQEGSK